jgi:bacillopeptidase F (M6 metalloprotease family)
LNVTPPPGWPGNKDYLYVIANDVTDPSSPTQTTLVTFSGTDASPAGWVEYWVDLGGFEGRSIQLQFQANESAGTKRSTFAIDDISVF